MACRAQAACCSSIVRGAEQASSRTRHTIKSPEKRRSAGRLLTVHCAAVQQKGRSGWGQKSAKTQKTQGGTVRIAGRSVKRRQPPDEEEEKEGNVEGAILAAVGGVAVLALAYAVANNGIEDTLENSKAALMDFQNLVKDLGPLGYILYIVAYAGLEVFLLPATPIALTGGALFGVGPGTLISAVGGLLGAVSAFTIGRTIAREPVSKWASGSKPFTALERALDKDGFKVVLLVNLSPLASLANLLNYAYGTTSVTLASFASATAISVLPRTFATVQAGNMGKNLLAGEEAPGWLAMGSLVAAVAATVYITGLAKEALDEFEDEDNTRL